MPTIRTAAGKGAELTPTEADTDMKRPAIAQASNYNLTAAHNRDFHELANGVTATLPTASTLNPETDDWEVTLKAVGASATVGRNSQNIDGAASDLTLSENETVTVVMNADQDGYYIKHRYFSPASERTLTGDQEFDGYVTLGEVGPKIKTKKVTGTTGAGSGDSGSAAHGLDATKIISINYLVHVTASNGYSPGYRASAGYHYNAQYTSSDVVIVNFPAESANIYSKAFTAFIVYEE